MQLWILPKFRVLCSVSSVDGHIGQLWWILPYWLLYQGINGLSCYTLVRNGNHPGSILYYFCCHYMRPKQTKVIFYMLISQYLFMEYAYIPILIYEISLNKINVMVGIIIGKYGFEYTKIKIKLNFSNNFCSYFYYPKQTAVGIISFSCLSHQ